MMTADARKTAERVVKGKRTTAAKKFPLFATAAALEQVVTLPTPEEQFAKRMQMQSQAWQSFYANAVRQAAQTERYRAALYFLLGDKLATIIDERSLALSRRMGGRQYYQHLLMKEIAAGLSTTQAVVYYIYDHLALPEPGVAPHTTPLFRPAAAQHGGARPAVKSVQAELFEALP